MTNINWDMWILKRMTSGETFPMLTGRTYTVGRETADLVLKDDKSISGVHASVFVTQTDSGALLEVNDSGSKNGTFLNDDIKTRKPLKKNLATKLNENDCIQFGVIGNTWRACKVAFCSLSSGLTAEDCDQLDCLLKELGGSYVSAFHEECTHLTMKEIKITMKVIYALLSGIPIVSFEYWQDLLKISMKQKKGPMPPVDEYLPRVADILLAHQDVNLRYMSERTSVFSNKTFVFLSQKQFQVYSPLIEKAGGSSKELKNGIQKAFLLRKNVAVVQYLPSRTSQNSQSTHTLNTVTDYLKSHSRRFIPEYEIALAIVLCSTQKYCNPIDQVANDFTPSETFNGSESICVQNTSLFNIREDLDSSHLHVGETEKETELNKSPLAVVPMKQASSWNDMSSNFIHTASKSMRKSVEHESFDKECKISTLHSTNINKFFNSASDDGLKVLGKECQKTHSNACCETSNDINSKFTDSTKKRRLPDMGEDEDDLFNFDFTTQEIHIQRSPKGNDNKSDTRSLNTSLEMGQQSSRKRDFFRAMQTPKALEVNINTKEWKTCSCKKMQIVPLKTENSQQFADDHHPLEVKHSSGCFQIKLSTLTGQSFKETRFEPLSSGLAVCNNENLPNFKKFVKQKLNLQH